MREIKFRAWDSKNKKFPFVGFHIIGECTAFDLINQYRLEELNDLEVTEWAGCQDKNGKDIYEGDIVNYKGRKGTVVFFACSFRVDWGDQTDDDLGYLMISDLEVVGNRFEL